MITTFKIFEIYGQKNKVWVIPLKMPDFIISLQKIGMKDEKIDWWINLHKKRVFTDNGNYPNRETISVKKDPEYEDGYTWFWCPISRGDEWTEFMGKLEITPDEIKDYYNNIEIKKDSEKYNL